MTPSFMIWLEHHQDKFKTYTLDEIAQLATICGFDSSDVQQWLTREKFRKAS